MPEIEFITSESVTEGHPDKICDQIADAILDAYLRQDVHSRVAVEALITKDHLIIAGEVTSHARVNVEKITRDVIKGIGYDDVRKGLDYKNVEIEILIHEQSPDIARGVVKKKIADQGAGDQGMMYGFAVNETKELMPLPIILAHKLAKRLAVVRKRGIVKNLYPDGKTQVVVEYRDGWPYRLRSVLVSAQHSENLKEKTLRNLIISKVVKQVISSKLFDENMEILVNPTGRFIIGGPTGDTGLTGRKIIVDTYGGVGRHGGGSFSGKDPSKVDRSGSYAMRWVAKNLVASGICRKAETKVSYAIGMSRPLSVDVKTFGTGKFNDQEISKAVQKVFDLRPGAIIRDLRLLRPIYFPTAVYGHFGRSDLNLPWEQINKVRKISYAFKIFG